MMFLAKLQKICLAAALIGVTAWGGAWLAHAGSTTQQERSPLPPPNGATRQELALQLKEKRVDLYGDALPDGAVMRLGTVQLRAAGANLTLSQDGKTLIGVRGGRFLSFWDVASGKLKESREIAAEERSDPMFSADGRRLATDKLHIWDVNTGKLLQKLDPSGKMKESETELFPRMATSWPRLNGKRASS